MDTGSDILMFKSSDASVQATMKVFRQELPFLVRLEEDTLNGVLLYPLPQVSS